MSSIATGQQSRGSILNRRRVHLIVVNCRQIPLTATDQIDDRRTLQSHSVAAAQVRPRRIDQMRRGLVVLRRVVQIAPWLLWLTGQLLHIDRTEVCRVSIHAVHIEALAAIQRLVRPGWLGGACILEDSCCGRGGVLLCICGRVTGVDDRDVASHAVRF